MIDGLIQTALDEIIDGDAWDAAIAEEESSKESLESASDNWGGVRRYLKHRSQYLALEDYNEAEIWDIEELLAEMDRRMG